MLQTHAADFDRLFLHVKCDPLVSVVHGVHAVSDIVLTHAFRWLISICSAFVPACQD